MAHSLEVREPLMDHELVEWAATLPSAYKLQGSNGKAIFKKAMEPHLPHDVLYRPKMGFSVPLARWFRGPLKDRVRSALLEGALAQSGYLDPTVVRELLDQHQAGSHDHSIPLWSLTMFDAFLRRSVGDTPAPWKADAPQGAMPALA
jgi:asparagine synthase (glutamine-hydrolysing)